MSNVRILMAAALVSFGALLSSCGDGGRAAREKATADSLEAVRLDSIAEVRAQAREDSLAAAEEANAPRTVVRVAGENNKTLTELIKAAGLETTLNDASQKFTLFAPTDAAFATMQSTVDNLKKPENREKLQKLLMHHVIAGQFKASALKNGDITAAGGDKVRIKIANKKPTVDGANVVTPDLEATNGVVHVVDKVLVIK